MGLLECASGASVWRGYDYFKEKKVRSVKKLKEGVFIADVCGSAKEPYTVELHVKHPRKSKCNCPHANGKRIICKHIVAMYFTILPDKAEEFYAKALAYEEEQERHDEEISQKVIQYVCKMKKSELQQTLLELLSVGSEWQYERFVRENGLDEERG